MIAKEGIAVDRERSPRLVLQLLQRIIAEAE